MKAHLIDTHLLVPRSRSSAKVKVNYQGHVYQKMGVSGAFVFRKHILSMCSLSPANAWKLDWFEILLFGQGLIEMKNLLISLALPSC